MKKACAQYHPHVKGSPNPSEKHVREMRASPAGYASTPYVNPAPSSGRACAATPHASTASATEQLHNAGAISDRDCVPACC